MTVQPSTRAQIVTARTYLRPLDEQETVFETPAQAIERIISHQRWLWQRAKGGMRKWGDNEWVLGHLLPHEEDELTEFKQLLSELKVTVSGRTRWLGGTEICKRRESTMFNPLPADTQFITSEGVRSFEDFQDGDTLKALTHTGAFQDAVVGYAGIRETVRLTLRRGRTVVDQVSSIDHKWLLKDGTRVSAADLKIGDQLISSPVSSLSSWSFETASPDQQSWWCFGFTFGDGALCAGTSRVRLCGDKAKYLERFTACGFEHSYPPSCQKDPIVYTGSYLKTLPDADADPRLIEAFLAGYLAADGSKAIRHGRTVVTGLSVSCPLAADFVRTWAPRFGLYILQDKEEARVTNLGTFTGTHFSFSAIPTEQGAKTFLWTVEGVSADKPQACWCLTVEEDHSFVLPNGIVTGNCAFLEVSTVHDIVDTLWLLLQGCGVGFRPVVGNLNGFANKMEIETVRSTRGPNDRGPDDNNETFRDGVWTIQIGDSSEAWAKAAGKIMAGKRGAKKLILDYGFVRGPGGRLRNYGWISSGDEQIAKGFAAIAEIMSNRAGELLTRIDILDIVNWLGTILSSRRSAQIALLAYSEQEWEEFARAKKDYWVCNIQRAMSNNSLMFYQKPTKYELKRVFRIMEECGGSEPGFINAVAAQKRAPWFKGVNPCGEILLGNKSFCNLVETVLYRFNNNDAALHRAHYLVARANYRQTCVDLRDGVLQDGWHQLNEFLRLCGVGVTGVVAWEHVNEEQAWRDLNFVASQGADTMADELGMPRSKAITTIKPSGTQSKAMSLEGMECPEGIHKPLGRYIFNNIRFSVHDPIVAKLKAANYFTFPDPNDVTGILVRVPVEFNHIEFDVVDGLEVNNESAVAQLDRYKMVMDNYVDHNCSITISYGLDEVPAIIDWLMENWDSYVGVSFIYRNDPTKTAADLGHQYLPQEVVTRKQFKDYTATLLPVELFSEAATEMLDGMECVGGACPVR